MAIGSHNGSSAGARPHPGPPPWPRGREGPAEAGEPAPDLIRGWGPAPTRRRILLATAGLALTPFASPASATEAALDEAIRALVGEAAVNRGRVKLELPPIVENGNTVPLAVSVDSPMTEDDHVTAIHIFNQKNPQPHIAAFHLGPRAGKAAVSTRIRLADSQKLVAVARLSDGRFWSDSADVIVTLAACTEQ